MKVDVVIAGAGIAGAAAAVNLGQAGFRVCVIEPAARSGVPLPAEDIASVDPRVSAISPASETLLRELDVWSRLPGGVASAYTRMSVWESDGTGAIGFAAEDIGQGCLGHIIENRWVSYALMQAMQLIPGVDLRLGERVVAYRRDADSQQVEVELSDGRSITTALLIGADGGQSRIRELAGIGVRADDTGQSAIVATVLTQDSHAHTAWQNFLPTGPLAFLPLNVPPAGRVCSIVWSAERPFAEELMALDDPGFCMRLGRAIEHRLGPVSAVSKRFCIALHQQHASRYSVPGVVLVGDAAHLIHPLAGQGINLGLSDVRVLGLELRRARERGLSLGDSGVLARYERRRRGDNALMLEAMTGFRLLFGATHPGIRLLRNAGVRAVDNLRPLKLAFMRHAMGA